MADQWNGGQSGPGERWNVNLPAVIGVVFVFLVGVIVWVVAASAGDDEGAIPGSSVPSVSTTSLPPGLSTASTTPLPMPSTTVVPPTSPLTVPATAAPTVAPTAATAPPVAPPPPTAAPTVAPTVAPTTQAPAPPPPGGGDLGVPGHPMQSPPCNGGFITVLASAIGSQATAESMGAVLDDFSGSNYLRTDVTCSSLTPSSNGQPIYVVYLGPFATDIEACNARDDGPDDSYVRRLSNDLGPNHTVDCD
jgi:serine/threonine-protein kinase